MLQFIEHSTFEFGLPDILAIALFVGVAVCGIIRNRKLKEKKRELEDRVSAKYLDDIM